MITNIMISGVGGQGLVLMTKLVSHAAFHHGYDVKTNDVVGLSQRGGMVWGNIRFGESVLSPNIRPGHGDILVSLEPLEALRWSHILKDGATIILNTKEVFPTLVQQEKEPYPWEEIEAMNGRYKVISLNAFDEAKKLGKKEMANTILLGILSNRLDITKKAWKLAFEDCMKPSLLKMNLDAFQYGKELKV